MARIERKAYYVGTWREDVVTDTTMRQIIARSHAEKGQKVKVKLSQDGMTISKTVLLQENFLSAIPLRDVYFLTVNQRHPTCLLCIVADPVKKYLILAIRTINEVEAQEIISTFKALKNNPTINAGNVVLRRKDNGNWTLRERSQHNANRHMQEIFKETTPNGNSDPVTQPNGNARAYTPILDSRSGSHSAGVYRKNTGTHVIGNGSHVDNPIDDEEEALTQELRDLKFVVEKAGSVSPATLQSNTSSLHNNNNNNTEKTRYIMTEVPASVHTKEIVVNGDGVVRAHSDGAPQHLQRPGMARVVVEDHRQDGVVRAHSNGSAVVVGDTRIQRPIVVPEPNSPVSVSTTISTTPPTSESGYDGDAPTYTVHRRVSTEYVQVPDLRRKFSQAESVRSVRVSFDPEALRRSQDRHNQFRSLRTSRNTGVPTTIVRPIEQIYGRNHVLVRPRPTILKQHPEVYVAQQPPNHPANAVYVVPQQPMNGVYVAPRAVPHTHTHSHPRRRSRPNSIHIMDRNELKVFHKSGELDDVLL